GAEVVPAGELLHDAVGEAGSHVVEEEVREERDAAPAERADRVRPTDVKPRRVAALAADAAEDGASGADRGEGSRPRQRGEQEHEAGPRIVPRPVVRGIRNAVALDGSALRP